ncbi:sigma-70 family RNA polymerase sigma factor [Asticcacaulis sp. W401b]|uniref:sigma-70 family RNA polymerase sigma factor n=1 Tax=Asticcacaulis sp. W401b TaxID=3388666 RepID=UPI00397112A8
MFETSNFACAEDHLSKAFDRHAGGQLRLRRRAMQISQERLARELGMSVDQLQAIEEGRARIDRSDMARAAAILGVPLRFFFTGFDTGYRIPKDELERHELNRWFSSHLFPHEGMFLAVGRRLTGSAETARELLQDLYADIVAGEKWRRISNPRAYALKAIRNLAAMWFRRSRVVSIELVPNFDSFDPVDLNPSAHEVLSAKEKRRLILEAIETLPPQCRKVVKMRRLKEMPPQEIARELGISVSMVEKHLAKGMAIIASRLCQDDFGS